MGTSRGTFYENATSAMYIEIGIEKSLSLSLHCNCPSWISNGVSSCSCQLILKISLLELIISNIDKLLFSWVSLMAQRVQNQPEMQDTRVQSLVWGSPREENSYPL